MFFGVVLAADSARTAVAMIRDDLDRDRVVLESLSRGVDDDNLVSAITAASKARVAPFDRDAPDRSCCAREIGPDPAQRRS